MDSKDLLVKNFALEKCKNITFEVVDDVEYKKNDAKFRYNTFQSIFINKKYNWYENLSEISFHNEILLF